MFKLLTPQNNEIVSLLIEVQKEFLRRNAEGKHTSEESYEWLDKNYAKGFSKANIGKANELNLTHPATVEFKWESEKTSHLVISRSCDFVSPDNRFPGNPGVCEFVSVNVSDNVYTVNARNLFADTTYYWKVVADDRSEESEVRSFITAKGYPRAIAVHGTTNVRDLGGLPTCNGKHVRQGCIYRGSALEKIVDPTDNFVLTERGKYVMRDVLNIKNEIDIRMSAKELVDRSAISDNVKFNLITSRGYELFFEDHMDENRRILIEFFADENNYPIYFHCAIGADRTGTLAMFLLMLLGVPRYYIDLDYNITSLTVSEKRCGITNGFYDMFLRDYKGDEPEREVVNNIDEFLISHSGVSKETLEKLRNNLLE